MRAPRREVLRSACLVAAGLLTGLLKPVAALAADWNRQAFGSKSSADAMKSLGTPAPESSAAIVIEAPQIAENGAVVPIEVTSNIPGTTSLAVLVDQNPYPLVAKFDFTDDALPFAKINAKMGKTSLVRVVASAGGRNYAATREIKVTIGGCGG